MCNDSIAQLVGVATGGVPGQLLPNQNEHVNHQVDAIQVHNHTCVFVTYYSQKHIDIAPLSS